MVSKEHLSYLRQLLDGEAISRALRRMANEILEREEGAQDIVLVGIRTGGVDVCDRLAETMKEIEGKEVLQGTVDITLYRDDYLKGLPRPEIGTTSLPLDLSSKKVILVDDVLYTGRTIRAALDVLNDYGRPSRVRLAVLVDRGRRELPIHADYIGLKVDTAVNESVQVEFDRNHKKNDAVILYQVDEKP